MVRSSACRRSGRGFLPAPRRQPSRPPRVTHTGHAAIQHAAARHPRLGRRLGSRHPPPAARGHSARSRAAPATRQAGSARATRHSPRAAFQHAAARHPRLGRRLGSRHPPLAARGHAAPATRGTRHSRRGHGMRPFRTWPCVTRHAASSACGRLPRGRAPPQRLRPCGHRWYRRLAVCGQRDGLLGRARDDRAARTPGSGGAKVTARAASRVAA